MENKDKTQKHVRTYRIMYYPSKKNQDAIFFGDNFEENPLTIKHKGNQTQLKKRDNTDFYITSDTFKGEKTIIYTGEHNILKKSDIRIDDESGVLQAHDHYYEPNTIEFHLFPTKKLFLLKANKQSANHIISGIETINDISITKESANLKEIIKHENRIKGITVKPNTPNCETLSGWGDEVHKDEQIEKILELPDSVIVQIMVEIDYNNAPIPIGITKDGGVIIYTWNENLEDDISIVFYVHEKIIKAFR